MRLFRKSDKGTIKKIVTWRWSDVQLQEFTDYNSKGTHSFANSKDDNNASF